MKDQYFGDINDYRKYGLLRFLSNKGEMYVAICWMWTESDGGNDGGKLSYLNRPSRYRAFDPELFDELRTCLSTESSREVALAEKYALVPRAVYYRQLLTDSVAARRSYFRDLLDATRGVDLLFFDPDNGLEVASVSYGGKGSSKYLYWNEMTEVYNAGHSILVYQHFPRKDRDKFRSDLFRELCTRLKVLDAIMFTTPSVLFVLVPQAHHLDRCFRLAMEVERRWGDEIKFARMRLEKDLIMEAVFGEEMKKEDFTAIVDTLAGLIYKRLS